MTGRDPFAVGSLFERSRDIGESDRQRAGEFGGRLVSELADRAMLIGYVLLVTEDLGGGGAGHRHHQDYDPGAPVKAAPCELRVCAFSPDHRFHASARNASLARRFVLRRKLLAGAPGCASRTCSLRCSQPSTFPPTPPRLLRTVHTCPRPRPCDVSRQNRGRRHPRQAVLRSADPRARPTSGSGCR